MRKPMKCAGCGKALESGEWHEWYGDLPYCLSCIPDRTVEQEPEERAD